MGPSTGIRTKEIAHVLEQGKAVLDPANQPVPGFVVKTWDEDDTKVFINVCSTPRVPVPQEWGQSGVPKVVQNLEAEYRPGSKGIDHGKQTAFLTPMLFSRPRQDVDHEGRVCAVVDCALNPRVLEAAKGYRHFKIFLIHIIMSTMSKEKGIQLHDEFKLPRMKVRGVIPILTSDSWGPQSTDVDVSSEAGNKTVEKSMVEEMEEKMGEINAKDVSVDYIGHPVNSIKMSCVLPLRDHNQLALGMADAQAFVQGSCVEIHLPHCRPLIIETHLSLDPKTAEACCDVKKGILSCTCQITMFDKICVVT